MTLSFASVALCPCSRFVFRSVRLRTLLRSPELRSFDSLWFLTVHVSERFSSRRIYPSLYPLSYRYKQHVLSSSVTLSRKGQTAA